MEGSDAFAQTDDPFADGDFGDFEQPEPEAAPEPQEDIPTVDREGRPVEPAPSPEKAAGLPTLSPEQQAAEGEAYRKATGEPAPAADPLHVPQDGASVESQANEAAPVAEQAPEAALQPAERAPAATQDAPAPASGPQIEEPVQPDPEAAAAKVEAALQPDEALPPAASQPEVDEEDAPPPQEERGAGGRATKRQYVVLRVEGSGKYTKLAWYEDSKGKLAQRGPGNKRQTVLLARNTEDALRFGYAVVGSPPDGAMLVAVAAAYFQEKKVRPKPPEPTRQRLEIS